MSLLLRNHFVTGAWCTEKLAGGSKFGPFVGRTLQEGKEKKVDFRYAWEVSYMLCYNLCQFLQNVLCADSCFTICILHLLFVL